MWRCIWAGHCLAPSVGRCVRPGMVSPTTMPGSIGVRCSPFQFCASCPLLTLKIKIPILMNCILDFNLALEAMIGRVEDSGIYVCHQCGKRMLQKDKIKRHAEVHLNLALPCNMCGKVLKTRNALAQHYSGTHGQTVSYTNVL